MNADGQGTREKAPYRGFWDMLTQAERADLRAVGQVTQFGPSEPICTEGEETTHVLVLTQGWVKIVLATGDHHAMTLALRGHGDIVGELAESSAGYRTATVVTIGLVRALVVAHDRFSLFLDSNPGADGAYRQVVTERWREAAEMLRRWSVSNGAQRLAGLLLDLADRHGTHTECGIVITIPLSQQEMASLIGASRATVTRALGDWRRRGLIGTARHQITILHTHGLRSVAGRDLTDPVRGH